MQSRRFLILSLCFLLLSDGDSFCRLEFDSAIVDGDKFQFATEKTKFGFAKETLVKFSICFSYDLILK